MATDKELTLHLDEETFGTARRLAAQRGISISQMIIMHIRALGRGDVERPSPRPRSAAEAPLPGAEAEAGRDLPAELVETLASLALLDDESLTRVAAARMSDERAELLEGLHHQRQAHGLTSSEEEQVRALMEEYSRMMLMRAEAVALLKERRHDVSLFFR